MNKLIKFTVSGKVQGVWFRKFTYDTAQTFNLNGWVRNESDGSVSGEAEGIEEDLLKLLDELNIGSKFSRVDKVDVSWHEYSNKYSSFEVRY
jgi:acylphosphatase